MHGTNRDEREFQKIDFQGESACPIIRIIMEEFYTVIISSRAVFWIGGDGSRNSAWPRKKKIIVAIFLIPGSSIIQFEVKEEGKEKILDCLVDNWLISWASGSPVLAPRRHIGRGNGYFPG